MSRESLPIDPRYSVENDQVGSLNGDFALDPLSQRVCKWRSITFDDDESGVESVRQIRVRLDNQDRIMGEEVTPTDDSVVFDESPPKEQVIVPAHGPRHYKKRPKGLPTENVLSPQHICPES